MTDACGTAAREALAAFGAKWAAHPLVLLKLWATLAASNVPGNLAAVQAVMASPAFQMTNPNRCGWRVAGAVVPGRIVVGGACS